MATGQLPKCTIKVLRNTEPKHSAYLLQQIAHVSQLTGHATKFERNTVHLSSKDFKLPPRKDGTEIGGA